VVFDDVLLAENLAIDPRRLLENGRKGRHDDHTSQPVRGRVSQRERHAAQRLASAGSEQSE
jgi:hypothetical protein